MKQVAVDVVCHGDRGMTEHRLNLLRRPSLLDEQRCGGVTQCMQREPRSALAVHDTAFEHERLEDAIVDIRMRLDLPDSIGEHQVELAGRTGNLPCLKHLRKLRTHWNLTPP